MFDLPSLKASVIISMGNFVCALFEMYDLIASRSPGRSYVMTVISSAFFEKIAEVL